MSGLVQRLSAGDVTRLGDNPAVPGPKNPDDQWNDAGPGVQIRTFLIADVRGYTLFTQERGDEAAAKLAAKFAGIAREEVEARGGTLLELRGDEALCVFSSARQAIRTAVELQQRFVEETLDQPELPLTVGIGLDAGEAVPVEGGYRGGALNLAARLCGQAQAGEIIASREVTHLARRVDGIRYEDRGTMSLKGLSDPVSIVWVVAEDLDAVERLKPFGPTQPPPARAGRRPRAMILPIVLVLALIVIAFPLLRSEDGIIDVDTNSIARLDPEDPSVDFATALGERPGASAAGFESLWVVQPDRGSVARVDLEDGSVTDTIPVGTSPAGVAFGEGSVWVTNSGDGTIARIDPETNEVSQTLQAGSGPSGIAIGDGALWVADAIGTKLLRIDPTSGEVQSTALAGQPSGVAFTPAGVWVSVAPAEITRVEAADPVVTLTQGVGSGPSAVHSAFGSIWVANHLDGTVSRLEPSTGRVQATIAVGEGPSALAAAAGSLWVANEFDGSITKIDPATDTAEQTIPVGGEALSLTTADQGLWLAVGASAGEHRGGTLTISSEEAAPTSLDPAVSYDPVGWAILSNTNDGLLAYNKVGGPEGANLVPDLAAALPQVSTDGRTYLFPLREGIRYSTGEQVRPEDFRRGLERSISLEPAAAEFFSAIEGVEECREDRSPCHLPESIIVDDESVTIRLARPDADLPFKLALPFAFPVPARTPIEDQGLDALPATGPYMIGEASSRGIELVRNPEFRQWSGAAQPDGFVDAISWRFGEDLASSFDRLSAGDVDVMASPPRPNDLASLQASHPDQVVQAPQAFTTFVGLDVLKPPFDDERVRQALNYAIDRDLVVELLGGPTVQHPTCQILPPNFQGYVPNCPYTLEPDQGVWSSPDLDRARELIEDADAVGEKVTVWVSEIIPGAVDTMRHVTEVLNEIGLQANLKVVPNPEHYFGDLIDPAGTAPGSPGHPQAHLNGWIQDYPAASNFIQPLFSCGGFFNFSGYCSDSLDAQIEEAFRLYATDPGASTRTWTDIERQLVDDAVVAPLTNPLSTNVVSARTGNVQIHPQWGILLSRLWVQ
jgi:YVTN family beta-propeller protein